MADITMLMGKAPEGDDSSGELPSDGDMGELDEKEVVEHKMNAAKAFIEAIHSGSESELVKAFDALHGLDHRAWELEDGTPEEGEE